MLNSAGYYPPSQTAEYTEDSPPGNDFIGKLAQDWEQVHTNSQLSFSLVS